MEPAHASFHATSNPTPHTAWANSHSKSRNNPSGNGSDRVIPATERLCLHAAIGHCEEEEFHNSAHEEVDAYAPEEVKKTENQTNYIGCKCSHGHSQC